jgi:hypothetical protein
VGLSDRVNALTAKAKQTAAEHKDDIQRVAAQAKTLADKQTHGKYQTHINKAAAKVDAFLDKLPDPPDQGEAEGTPEPE